MSMNPLKLIVNLKDIKLKSNCCNGIPPEESEEHTKEEEKPKKKKLSDKK